MAAPASMRGLFLFFVASALAVCLLTISIRSFASSSSARVELFDVDGPSIRDPSRAQWAKGGHGTAYWMETHAAHANKQKKAFWNHHAGDEFVRHHAKPKGPMAMHAPTVATARHTPGVHAPEEDKKQEVEAMVKGIPTTVSKALDIPLGEVQAMAFRVKSDLHSKQIRRQYAKKQQAGAMLAEVKLEDMSECNGKAKKCDPLAENIVKVAEAIQEECFELYFQESEYYECVEKHGGPLCDQVGVDFPGMCQQYSYKTDHGYIGSEDPANTPGELCQACYQLKTSNCFAETETLLTPQGEKQLAEVQAGDTVRVHAHTEEYATVIYVHKHPTPAALLTFTLASGRTLSLTPSHPLPSDQGLTMASRVKEGAHLTAHDGSRDQVVSVSRGAGHVVYFVLHKHLPPLVSGVVCAAESTLMGQAETLPFRFLHSAGMLGLAPVKAALYSAIESPLLRATENLLNALNNNNNNNNNNNKKGTRIVPSSLPLSLSSSSF